MSNGAQGHRFNDDLLANPGDFDEAASRWRSVIHVLDHPELRDLFQAYDDPANEAKRNGRKWGILAIGLGALGLFGTSAVLSLHGDSLGARLIALASAVAGISGVIIALRGALWYRAKTDWLRQRLMTERLRQFHFQTFVCRWPALVASLASAEAKSRFAEERRSWFLAFRSRMERGLIAEFENLMRDVNDRDVWQHHPCDPSTQPKGGEDANELFAAYRELRIEHQIRYANFKLSPGSGIISASAQSQLAMLSNSSLIGIAGLVLLHIVIAASIGLSLHDLVPLPLIHLLAIWLAIAALVIRALEEGLQPAREIERYQQYRAAVRAVLERFDSADTPAQKLDAMRDLERLAFEEMTSFLRANNEARFII